jgi:putative ABC transport system permease protein
MMADLRYRLRALLRGAAMDRELDDELRFHLERAAQKHVEAGVPAAEALRRARVEFGGEEQIREATRSMRGLGALDVIHQDVRYAVSRQRMSPAAAP